MVIVPSRIGQLGNQLFHIAHFAASSLEQGYKVRFSAFQYCLDDFPRINTHPNIEVTETSVFRNRCQHRIFKVASIIWTSSLWHECIVSMSPPHVDVGLPDFAAKASAKVVFCEGFGFRDPTNIRKHFETVVDMFQLSDRVCCQVDAFERTHKRGIETLVVGFHVRRGDYRSYCGGQHFLETDQWRKLIEETRQHFVGSGRNFLGVIFSNEDSRDVIGGLPDLVAGPGGLLTDLEMLSRCDMIVGPESTYSGWASFVRRVPILRVNKNTCNIDFGQFEIVNW